MNIGKHAMPSLFVLIFALSIILVATATAGLKTNLPTRSIHLARNRFNGARL